jgi:hypothetical protein
MYDFLFGDKEEIIKNPEDFLLFCKRMSYKDIYKDDIFLNTLLVIGKQ